MTNPHEALASLVRAQGHPAQLSGYVHLIFGVGEPAPVRWVTCCDQAALQALRGGDSVVCFQPAATVLLAMHQAPLTELMDDATWQAVAADALLEMAGREQVALAQTLWDATPPDLPATFAERRLQLFRPPVTGGDLATMIELVEIVMAVQGGRPVNEARFRRSSLLSSWRALSDKTETQLSAVLQRNLMLQSQYVTLGESAHGPEALQVNRILGRLEVEQRELTIAIMGQSRLS